MSATEWGLLIPALMIYRLNKAVQSHREGTWRPSRALTANVTRGSKWTSSTPLLQTHLLQTLCIAVEDWTQTWTWTPHHSKIDILHWPWSSSSAHLTKKCGAIIRGGIMYIGITFRFEFTWQKPANYKLCMDIIDRDLSWMKAKTQNNLRLS